MATNDALKSQLAEKPQKQVAAGQLGLKALMNTPTMRKSLRMYSKINQMDLWPVS